MVPQQWLANTTVPGVDPADRRRLDLVVYGASPHGHVLSCDATVVSPLKRNGLPQPHAADRDGAALATARRRKRATYNEVLRRGPARLVVLGSEVGGRWDDEALKFVSRLVRQRTRAAPRLLRKAAAAAWQRRWWALLSVAVQNALAQTLATDTPQAMCGGAGFDEPFLADVLDDAPIGPEPSRLPLRG